MYLFKSLKRRKRLGLSMGGKVKSMAEESRICNRKDM